MISYSNPLVNCISIIRFIYSLVVVDVRNAVNQVFRILFKEHFLTCWPQRPPLSQPSIEGPAERSDAPIHREAINPAWRPPLSRQTKKLLSARTRVGHGVQSVYDNRCWEIGGPNCR